MSELHDYLDEYADGLLTAGELMCRLVTIMGDEQVAEAIGDALAKAFVPQD